MNKRGKVPGIEQRRREIGVKVRLKDGHWYVLIAANGKRRSRYFGANKDAAETWAEKVRTGLRMAKALRGRTTVEDFVRVGALESAEPETAGASVTFEEYAARFLERYDPREQNDGEGGLKLSTWLDYKSCLEGRIKAAIGDRALSSIRRSDRKALEDRLRQAKLSSVNIRKHLRIISSVLTAGVEEELIPINPFLLPRSKRHRSRARSATSANRVRPFRHDEVTHLLKTAMSHSITRKGSGETIYPYRRDYPLLLTLARTGLRWGEAIALRWTNVDWRGGFLNVEESHVRNRTDVPKSGRRRLTHMSPQLQATLHALYHERFNKVRALDAEQQAELDAAQATEASEALIFTNHEGRHLNNRNFHRDVWRPLLTAAKLSHHTIKDLRHTAGTLLAERVALPHYVKEQLGHGDVAFTMRQYVHLASGYANQTACLDDPTLPFAPSAPISAPTATEGAHEADPETTKPLAAQGVSAARPG